MQFIEAAGDDATNTEAMNLMPDSLDAAGFYAATRLRLLPASQLLTDAPFDKRPFWLLTVTPEGKGCKNKRYGVAEYFLVYVPPESTKIATWELEKNVRVLFFGPETVVTPGFEHTVQVVDPAELLPVPAAEMFSSVRVIPSRNGPGQIMAVHAIVAELTENSKFRQYQYFLDQPHNQPPVDFVIPHSKVSAEGTLDWVKSSKLKPVKEEELTLNLPVGTRVWLHDGGFLQAGLIFEPTNTMNVGLIAVRAERNKKKPATTVTAVSEAGEVTAESRTLGRTCSYVSI